MESMSSPVECVLNRAVDGVRCVVGARQQIVLTGLALLLLTTPLTRAAQLYGNTDDLQLYQQDLEDNRDPQDSDFVHMFKRYYRGWGHRSRFPWQRLPHRWCYHDTCRRHKDCCYRWNLCDKSAKVCIDCWYGMNCKSEADCCANFPYCARTWKKTQTGKRYIAGGKCVRKL